MGSFSRMLFGVLIIAIFLQLDLAVLSANPTGGDEEYLAFAEVMPEPVGGMVSIIKKVQYPEIARQTQVQGRVYILAFIDENGNCVDAKVVRGIGAGCDEAAVEAVKGVKYNPGKSKGKPVKVKLSLPLEFSL